MNNGITREEMESILIRNFVLYYGRERQENFEIVRYEKPDFILISAKSGDKIAVECTLAGFHESTNLTYRSCFNRTDAIVTQEVRDGMSSSDEKINDISPVHSTAEIIGSINERIEEKGIKATAYKGEFPLILVMGLVHKLFGIESIKAINRNLITLPPANPFREIWFCVFMSVIEGRNGIVKIYP